MLREEIETLYEIIYQLERSSLNEEERRMRRHEVIPREDKLTNIRTKSLTFSRKE